jgi:hypothetical protein
MSASTTPAINKSKKPRSSIKKPPQASEIKAPASSSQDAGDGHEQQLDGGIAGPSAPSVQAWQPPPGTTLADLDVEFGAFDYDAVRKDEEAELWLVRVPAKVRVSAHVYAFEN